MISFDSEHGLIQGFRVVVVELLLEFTISRGGRVPELAFVHTSSVHLQRRHMPEFVLCALWTLSHDCSSVKQSYFESYHVDLTVFSSTDPLSFERKDRSHK